MAGTTPSIEEQRAFIKTHFEGVAVQEREVWYPLNALWWDSLLKHVQWQTQGGEEEAPAAEGKEEAPSPGAIDNAALGDAETPLALKAGLVRGACLHQAAATLCNECDPRAFRRRKGRILCG